MRIGERLFAYRRKVVWTAVGTGLDGSWYGFRHVLHLFSWGHVGGTLGARFSSKCAPYSLLIFRRLNQKGAQGAYFFCGKAYIEHPSVALIDNSDRRGRSNSSTSDPAPRGNGRSREWMYGFWHPLPYPSGGRSPRNSQCASRHSSGGPGNGMTTMNR